MSEIEWRHISPEEMIRDIEETVRQHRENKYAFQVGLKDLDFDVNEDLLQALNLHLPLRSIAQAEQALQGKAITPTTFVEHDDTEHQVLAFDRLLYSPKEYWAGRYFPREWMQAGTGHAVVRTLGNRAVRMNSQGENKARWEIKTMPQPRAIAVGSNAVLIAGIANQPPDGTPQGQIAACSLQDGTELWNETLPALPIWWAAALDAEGRILVSLQDGSVVCILKTES